ncbi:hypothetical protein ACLOJK_005051 [Asimina triloba]
MQEDLMRPGIDRAQVEIREREAESEEGRRKKVNFEIACVGSVDMAKTPPPPRNEPPPQQRPGAVRVGEEEEARWFSAARDCIEGNLIKSVPAEASRSGAFDEIVIRNGILKVDRIERGRITCVFPNAYNTLHGGMVASITEAMALGCARSVAGDKDFFLGELAVSYLSAAGVNTEVEVESRITKHGRNVIAASVEFRMKQSRKLLYNGRATFYNMPVSSL